MKKLLFLGLILLLLASCSNDEEFLTTNQDSLFSLTSENALKICGGKSRILENKNEEIIKIEIKDSDNERDKTVEFTAVETVKKEEKLELLAVFLKRSQKIQLLKRLNQAISLTHRK